MNRSATFFRSLSEVERQVLLHLLNEDFPGRDEILCQIAYCTVKAIDSNGSIRFRLESDAESAPVRRRVPVEGEAEDVDGIVVHFLLHVVDGRIHELEIFKEDGSRLMRFPDPSQIRPIVI